MLPPREQDPYIAWRLPYWNSIRVLRDVYAKIMSTDEVLGRVRALGPAPLQGTGGR
jgi:hypothetical protein